MPPYVLTDGDGEPIPGESYDDPDRALDARARLMEQRDDDVTVEEDPTPGATRKYLYLVTDHYKEAAVGCVEFSDGRHETVEKNSEGTIYVMNRKTDERKEYTVVGLGYYDFESEDDYEERASEVAKQKLAETDDAYLEKAGVDVEVPA